jgi:hypothetical protein
MFDAQITFSDKSSTGEMRSAVGNGHADHRNAVIAATPRRYRQSDGGYARIKPPVSFHALRHTWASQAVMNGVPLMAVAKNLEHRDNRMVKRHYWHVAPSYEVDAIHRGAPVFAATGTDSVVPMPTPQARWIDAPPASPKAMAEGDGHSGASWATTAVVNRRISSLRQH